jgi:hypothetical protein
VAWLCGVAMQLLGLDTSCVPLAAKLFEGWMAKATDRTASCGRTTIALKSNCYSKVPAVCGNSGWISEARGNTRKRVALAVRCTNQFSGA